MSIDARPAPEQPSSVHPPAAVPQAALSAEAAGGLELATLVGFDADGGPLVQCAARQQPVLCSTTVALGPDHVGRLVVVAHVAGGHSPIVLGGLDTAPAAVAPSPLAELVPEPPSDPSAEPLEVTADGKRIVLSAERELELRCGKASITLTRAGKILIRGAYVLSRSSGVNRIKGGAVHIN